MPARWLAARARSSVATSTPLSARAEFGDKIAPFVGDEAVAVELLAVLGADPVGGDHRHAVRHRMALHRAAPHPAGVEVRVVGFGADRGGIEQHFGPHQRHRPARIRDTTGPSRSRRRSGAAEHVPDLEAIVAGAEIVLLLIARPIGDVALAVGAQDLAVRRRSSPGCCNSGARRARRSWSGSRP